MKLPQKINFKTFGVSFLFLVFAAFISTSCSEETMNRIATKPNSFGKANDITVIADKDIWEGPVGDTFRYYFSSAYLILPQPEPILDLRHYTPLDLEKDPYRKELRTYVFLADMMNTDSPTTQLIQKNDVGSERIRTAKAEKGYGNIQKKDKWALKQLSIYMYATNEENLVANIKNNHERLTKIIKENDKYLVEANVFAGGENRKAEESVNNILGVKLRIPIDYFLAMNDTSTLLLRKVTQEYSSNIMLHKLPYTAKEQLSYQGIKSLRDSLTKRYISSEVKGSYMLINDEDLPMFVNSVEVDNLYAVEAKGIWELNTDFMGGSFISYLVYNPNSQELYLLDGFVFAPSKKKRELMQNLEFILNTAEFKT